MGELESLKAVAGLGFLSGDVKDRVDELSSLCVVTLGPVVTSTRLSKDEVVGSEDLAEWTRSDGIHGSWLEINKDGAWNVLAAGGLIVVDVDALELEIRIALVRSSGVDSVLVGDNLPELKRKLSLSVSLLKVAHLGTDLVTALTGLDVDNLSHVIFLAVTGCGG